MDSEGYPEEEELERIRKWDSQDFPCMLNFVEELHIYKNYIWREVVKDEIHKQPILKWTFCTGGWSGNESLIYAVLDNFVFKCMWYYSWQRGGKYVFMIDPRNAGYQLVSDYCKEHNVCRQYVSKAKDKFLYYKMTPNKVFVKIRIT